MARTLSTFRDRLAFAMDAAQMTQTALAKELRGVTPQAVGAWVRGENDCKQKYAVAQALNVSPEWLIDGIGEMAPVSPGKAHLLRLVAAAEEDQVELITALIEKFKKPEAKRDK